MVDDALSLSLSRDALSGARKNFGIEAEVG